MAARHGLTPADYQNEFNTWTGNGFFPACVQAAGPDKAAARFAVIFVKSETVVAKQFSATGPVSNANIDAVIKQAMKDSPVRHASLSIVHGTRLVYARGYTMAEPNWPVVQPTTCFRMASVSKTVTSLAVYQLIEAGALKLGHKLQDILALKTPAGGAPADSRFKDITIQHLLEHTSGVNADAFRNGVAVRDSYIAAGHPAATLPVSAEMTDAYIASLGMISTPGATQAYNNCGYYLLGRVVAKLRNKTKTIDAYQQYLFTPLSITRIRRAISLVANQPADEARYRIPTCRCMRASCLRRRRSCPTSTARSRSKSWKAAGGCRGRPPTSRE